MNPKTCEHCRYAIAPYKPMPTHDGSRWHCAKHFAGKWWDETCNQFTPRMKTEPLPDKSSNPSENITWTVNSTPMQTARGELVLALESALEFLTDEVVADHLSERGDGFSLWVDDVRSQVENALNKAKGQP